MRRGFFLKEVLLTKGRRSDADRYAYWAAAVALIPSGVFLSRKGRAIMRLLDVEYRVVKTALDIHEDSQPLRQNGHVSHRQISAQRQGFVRG